MISAADNHGNGQNLSEPGKNQLLLRMCESFANARKNHLKQEAAQKQLAQLVQLGLSFEDRHRLFQQLQIPLLLHLRLRLCNKLINLCKGEERLHLLERQHDGFLILRRVYPTSRTMSYLKYRISLMLRMGQPGIQRVKELYLDDAICRYAFLSVARSGNGGVGLKIGHRRMATPRCLRQIDSPSTIDSLEGIHICIHTINVARGSNAHRPMHDVFIIDSGSPLHCTGDRSLLSDYQTELRPGQYIRGAGGRAMRVHGIGSIRNEKFQVKDVWYVPGLNQQPNMNKIIISVGKLAELGYSVSFSPSGPSCSVTDNRRRWTWTLKPEVVGEGHMDHGQYMLDYLRIPLDRTSVSTSEGPAIVKSLWNAALSGLSAITERLSQRPRPQRPPV